MEEGVVGIPQGTEVLLTGATGFTGAWLLRKLAQAGLRVRAVARGSSDVRQFADLDIRWFRGNNYDAAVIAEAAAGVEYIFNLAAAYREAKIADEQYHRVHVVGTQLLAQAAAVNPSFKRFVHVSTVGVHGHIDNPPADENAPYHPGDVYQRTKLEAELWIREFAAEKRLPCTVIRPAAIYGPGDRRLLKVFTMAARPIFPLLGRGKCLYHLIHVDDLTDVILRAAWHPAAVGEVFIIGNPEPIALPRMAEVIAEALGRRTRPVRIPAWPFFLAGDLCEAVCKPLGLAPPIYRRRVAFFTKDRSFNTTKFRQRLSCTTKYGNEDGLRATAAWYREHGWI